ncbi:phospholipase D-like domain-containing protein [Nocardioides stalactiti]|uniref:phospholipase D-like domain-containing protein n=1 Tax=Nocardioides stalactiti TaxID=2755356 RepID=UPI0015FED3BA|nr:phospholipase D-like domain-containing protein [Nocardioides stalactiti]
MIRVATVVATLLAVLAGATLSPAVGDTSRASVAAEPRGGFTVERSMAMNDPTRNRGQVARELRTLIEHTPRGATISIMTFYMASSITWPALQAAYRRGVDIRAIFYGGPKGQPLPGVSSGGVKLTEMIRAGQRQGRRGSWVVWTKNSARGRDGKTTLHTKFWQFSKVGRTRKVTVVGSYNNSDAADARAYSAMVTLTLPDLYDAFQRVFAESRRDRKPPGNPLRTASGEGWDAYFTPALPITRDNDPVMDRLRAIPGAPETRIVVSMYSWQGYRGEWIARRLATMMAGGAKVTVVVGPDVKPPVLRILRAAGARLEDGCWRTGSRTRPYAYTHDKEMTATWVKRGETHYAAWIGSDDWGNGGGGSQSDQATVGLYDEWAFNRLNKLLAPQIAHEPDNLAPCDPLP